MNLCSLRGTKSELPPTRRGQPKDPARPAMVPASAVAGTAGPAGLPLGEKVRPLCPGRGGPACSGPSCPARQGQTPEGALGCGSQRGLGYSVGVQVPARSSVCSHARRPGRWPGDQSHGFASAASAGSGSKLACATLARTAREPEPLCDAKCHGKVAGHPLETHGGCTRGSGRRGRQAGRGARGRVSRHTLRPLPPATAVHTRTQTQTHARAHTRTDTCTQTHMHRHTHRTCLQAHTHAHRRRCAHTNTCTDTCTHSCTHTDTRARRDTHAQTHAPSGQERCPALV